MVSVDGENTEVPTDKIVSLAPGELMKILLCVVVPMVIYALAGVAPAFARNDKRPRKRFRLNRLLRVDAEHDVESPPPPPRTRPSRVGKFQRRTST